MTVLTFDKLAYVDRLKAAGFEDHKARAMADSLDIALREQVVTKADLAAELAPMKTDVAVLKWMGGFNLAISVAIVLKLFIH